MQRIDGNVKFVCFISCTSLCEHELRQAFVGCVHAAGLIRSVCYHKELLIQGFFKTILCLDKDLTPERVCRCTVSFKGINDVNASTAWPNLRQLGTARDCVSLKLV